MSWPRTVAFSGNASTRPLKTCLPRRPPCDRRFCACSLLQNCSPNASISLHAWICGRMSGIPHLQRATRPAGQTSKAPFSVSTASAWVWWRRRACRNCERKRTATSRVVRLLSRPMWIAGTCLQGTATRSMRRTISSMPGSRFLPTSGANRF